MPRELERAARIGVRPVVGAAGRNGGDDRGSKQVLRPQRRQPERVEHEGSLISGERRHARSIAHLRSLGNATGNTEKGRIR
jgi:hypothetical protein